MTDVNQLITDHLDVWTAAIEKKSSAGRGNGGAVSLYGVKKLRELILELAVRGKLVAQNESDGTAQSELIQLEQQTARIAKAGKFKQLDDSMRKPLGSRLFELPSSWTWCSLDSVAAIARGGSPRPIKSHITSALDGVPWIKIGDSQRGSPFIESTEEKIRPEGLKKSRLVFPGDLILSNSMSFGFPYIMKIEGAIHDGWLVIRSPDDLIEKRYLQMLFLSPLAKKQFEDAASGAVVQNLNADKVRQLQIALPPLAEQHRIVAKVDELMKLCDAVERKAEDSLKAHQTLVETCLATLTNSQSPEDLTQNWTRIEAHFDTLFTTEESVEALRRAVLDLALRGLLTEQISGDTPASDLLRKLYDKNKKSASSRHRTIVSKTKKAEPPFDLPESWAWSNLGLLSSDLRYGTSKKCDRDDKLVPVLRIPNVSGGRVDLDDMKFGPLDPKEVEDLRLRSNDLLIIRSNGSLDIVGSFAVVPELEGDFAFAGYLVRVRIDPAFVDPRYIWYISRSRFLRDQIEGPIRHGVGLKNVNSTELASLQFPIPPREEQERIVDKLDDLFELCDRLAQRVDDSNTINFALADTLTSKIN